jgi:hypothetical protein
MEACAGGWDTRHSSSPEWTLPRTCVCLRAVSDRALLRAVTDHALCHVFMRDSGWLAKFCGHSGSEGQMSCFCPLGLAGDPTGGIGRGFGEDIQTHIEFEFSAMSYTR